MFMDKNFARYAIVLIPDAPVNMVGLAKICAAVDIISFIARDTPLWYNLSHAARTFFR